MGKVRCEGERDHRPCDSYLGEIEAGKVRIYCRSCKSHHELYITDLVEDLLAYLAQAQPARNQFLESLARSRKEHGRGGSG